MPKRIHDISQKNNKTVRNIQTDKSTNMSSNDFSEHKRTSRWFSGGIWFLLILLILFLFFGLSVVFSGTTVNVHPKQANIQLDNTYAASAENTQANQLSYEIMTISERTSTTAQTSGQKQVQRYATGTITVFNDYSSQPLNLVENTRFESESGSIYRAPNPITVPGQHTNAAGETVPGTTTVMVRAAEPGATYNVEDTEFTIPGLRDFPSFEDTYAETETPISGGEAGVKQIVASSTESELRTELENKLKDRLLSTAHAQKPESFILYDDAIFMDFQKLPNKDASDGNVRIRQQGTLKGVIFENADLARFLARQHLSDYDDADVQLRSPSELNFEMTNKDSFIPDTSKNVQFRLSGSANLIWQFEKTTLREDLLNREKDDIQEILANYPSITKAEVIMRPFWKRSFPQNPEEIKIRKIIAADETEN